MASFQVTKQPITEFYKDEGGKNNWMTAVFKLVGLKLGVKSKKSQIPLRAILYYEGGQPVEARDQQILRLEREKKVGIMLDVKSKADVTIEINFRIEKVSRRKDNQKFQLCLEVDANHSLATKFKGIKAAFTVPICVLSKRKIPAHLRTDPATLAALKSGKKRTRSYSEARIANSNASVNLERMEIRLMAKLDKLLKNVEHLSNKVETQERTISTLANVVHDLQQEVSVINDKNYAPKSSIDLSALGSSARGGTSSILGQKRPSSSVSDTLRSLTPNLPGNGNGTVAAASLDLGGSTQSPLSWVKNALGSNVGGRASTSLSPRIGRNGMPAAVKRLRSEDMTFNFGAPGSNSPFGLERITTPGITTPGGHDF